MQIRTRIFIPLLTVCLITAPLNAVVAELHDITPAMINQACCKVNAGYNSTKATRNFTFVGFALALAGGLSYYLLGKKNDDTKKPDGAEPIVLPTLESLAKSMQKMEAHIEKQSESESIGNTAKGIAKTFAIITFAGLALDRLKDLLMGQERYSSIKAFKDANTSFNGHKTTVERELQFVSDKNATADEIEYWSHLYAQLSKATLKLCGYMQFRIGLYKAEGSRAEDMVPFAGVIKNVVAITKTTNAEMRTLFASGEATVLQLIEAITQYAVRVDIECGAFEVYEKSYNQGGF